MTKDDCIFCKIVAGSAPSHKVYEDDTHLAFLSIFPNTEGFTVVIPKEHHDSYFAKVPDGVLCALLGAVRTVALKIDTAFPDVGRTGLIFEGFGADHLHAKLVPMHGTEGGTWERHASSERKFFSQYSGYISSHDSERADDTELALVAEKIRAA